VLWVATAIFDYTGTEDDEISFTYGETIQVTSVETGDDDWYEGYIGRRAGIVPSTFVSKPDDVERCE
jgi:hypothetical protein